MTIIFATDQVLVVLGAEDGDSHVAAGDASDAVEQLPPAKRQHSGPSLTEIPDQHLGARVLKRLGRHQPNAAHSRRTVKNRCIAIPRSPERDPPKRRRHL